MTSLPAILQVLFAWMAGIIMSAGCRAAGWADGVAVVVAVIVMAMGVAVGVVESMSARFGRRVRAQAWESAAIWAMVAAVAVVKAAMDEPTMQTADEPGRFLVEVSSAGRQRATSIAYHVEERTSGRMYMLYWGGNAAWEPGDVAEMEGIKFALSDTVAYHRYLSRQGFSGTMYARTATARSDLPPSLTNRWRRQAWAARQWCLRQVDGHRPVPRVRALLQGCLFGDRGGFDAEVLEDFSYAGMGHLLAVSGLHVGILFALLWALFLPLRYVIGHRTVRVLSLLILWGYVALIGFPTSAVRAVVMFSMFHLSGILQRDTSGWHNWCVAAWLLLLYDTRLLWSLSFQMSFLAVAAIMFFRPELVRLEQWRCGHFRPRRATTSWRDKAAAWGRTVAAYVGGALMVSGAASVATLPLVLHYFHHLPLLGCVQAVVVLPLLTPYLLAVILLWTFHALALALPAAGAACATAGADICWWVVDGISRWILTVARWAHDGDVWIAGDVAWFPDRWEVAGLYAVLLSLLLWWRTRRSGWLIATLTAVVSLLVYGLIAMM